MQNKIFIFLITLTWSLAIASLIYTLLPNSYGIVLSVIIISLGIVSCFTERMFSIPSNLIKHHMPLLFNIFMFLAGLILLFTETPIYKCFFVFAFLGGLFGILYWILDKRYVEKNIKTILRDECHFLPIEVELTIAAIFFIDIIVPKRDPTTLTYIIILVNVLDAAIQFFTKKKNNSSI